MSETIKKVTKHPSFADMISVAIQKLGEKGGSSKCALLKYIAANYELDAKIANQYLKMALKNGVKSGLFKQAKGVGVTGSFKLGEKKKELKAKKLTVEKKVVKKPKTLIETTKPKKNITKIIRVKKIAAKATKLVETKKAITVKSKANDAAKQSVKKTNVVKSKAVASKPRVKKALSAAK